MTIQTLTYYVLYEVLKDPCCGDNPNTYLLCTVRSVKGPMLWWLSKHLPIMYCTKCYRTPVVVTIQTLTYYVLYEVLQDPCCGDNPNTYLLCTVRSVKGPMLWWQSKHLPIMYWTKCYRTYVVVTIQTLTYYVLYEVLKDPCCGDNQNTYLLCTVRSVKGPMLWWLSKHLPIMYCTKC